MRFNIASTRFAILATAAAVLSVSFEVVLVDAREIQKQSTDLFRAIKSYDTLGIPSMGDFHCE